MSLLDLAKEVKQNFNPSTDKVNGAEKIPAGEYDAVVSKVEFVNYNSGWENVVLTMEIVAGDQSGRKELVSFSFIDTWKGEEISEFIRKRNMKLTQKLAFVGGYQFTEKDFEDTYSVAEALKNIVGTQLILTISERENKKKPNEPYREYEVAAYEPTPNFAPERENEKPFDVLNEDTPF